MALSTVYRVHWLKAKARRNRWNEEFILLSSEMDWTVLYYRYQASRWQQRADQVDAGGTGQSGIGVEGNAADGKCDDGTMRGKICYAMKQKHLWHTMAEWATIAFERSKRKVGLSG
jgi:hypothetical protein